MPEARTTLLETRDGKKFQLYRLTPLYGPENDLKGFMAHTKMIK